MDTQTIRTRRNPHTAPGAYQARPNRPQSWDAVASRAPRTVTPLLVPTYGRTAPKFRDVAAVFAPAQRYAHRYIPAASLP